MASKLSPGDVGRLACLLDCTSAEVQSVMRVKFSPLYWRGRAHQRLLQAMQHSNIVNVLTNMAMALSHEPSLPALRMLFAIAAMRLRSPEPPWEPVQHVAEALLEVGMPLAAAFALQQVWLTSCCSGKRAASVSGNGQLLPCIM